MLDDKICKAEILCGIATAECNIFFVTSNFLRLSPKREEEHPQKHDKDEFLS